MMTRQFFLLIFGWIFLTGCWLVPMRSDPVFLDRSGRYDSDGERIYLTGTNADGRPIPYSGGPSTGMMMNERLTCAACHGADGSGGAHTMHMDIMDAPDIRISALEGEGESDQDGHDDHDHEHTQEYSLDAFRQAVVEGRHPDGSALDRDMPRWGLSDEELAQLFAFIQTLE